MTESKPNEPRGRIVVAGGSGFLGTSLAIHLTERGWDVDVLSRRPPAGNRRWRTVAWDARGPGDWVRALEGAAGLVNLTGRSVDCIKSPDHQDEILRSRVESTRALGQALRTCASPPPVWVQMSTAHIYGDPPVLRCTEDSPFGYGFAPTVGRAWEDEFRRGILPSQRGVVLRTGFVIGRDNGAGTGALGRLQMLVRRGLGGRVGPGRQGMSWIHEADMNRIFERALTDPAMDGAWIAASPNPVPQADFMRALRRAAGVPVGLPAFGWMVRLGAPLVLRTDPELALYGRYVIPQRLLDAGFRFDFPELAPALRDLLAPRPKPQPDA